MKQKVLPNVTISLIFSILSILCCCIPYGVGSIILAGITLFLVRKDKVLYNENPDIYTNYGSLKTAQVIAIIGLVIGLIFLILGILLNVVGEEQFLPAFLEEFEKEYQRELQANQ